MSPKPPKNSQGWRRRWYVVIFEADTPKGKAFDVLLLIAILLSVLTVVLESVPGLSSRYRDVFFYTEWILTVLFTAEYVVRMGVVDKPARYFFSFYGIVDLLSILPTYLSLFVTGTQSLAVVRAIRLLRTFRVLKLTHFLGEARTLQRALRASAAKIIVFIGVVVTSVVIIGALMYLIEGPENGFVSIPVSMYWAVVTLTTVGYGDIAPQTPLGQGLATLLMILGYGVIAVPTGIVSVEISKTERSKSPQKLFCHACGADGHTDDARYCRVCGTHLNGR